MVNYQKLVIMGKIILEIPVDVPVSSFDIGMIVASKLYTAGLLSSGQAAQMVGLSKRTFLELLVKFDTPFYSYTFSELEEDLLNA